MITPVSLPQISSLAPDEIILQIFSYLKPEELSQVAKVCRQWRIYAYDNDLWRSIEKRLPSMYPSLKFIGPEEWKEYVDLEKFGLSLEEPVSTIEGAEPPNKRARIEEPVSTEKGAEPPNKRARIEEPVSTEKGVEPLNKRARIEEPVSIEKGAAPGSKRANLIPILEMMHQVAPKVEGKAGITKLTIPEGLTLNKLVEIAGSPKKGNPTGFSYILDRVSQELGDIPVDKTYQVFIINNVLNGSRNKPFAAQQKLAEDLKCRMPGVLEASTLCILTAIISGVRICGDTRLTYTRTWQKMDDYNLSVGNFGSAGLCVGVSRFDTGSRCCALVLRELPVIGT